MRIHSVAGPSGRRGVLIWPLALLVFTCIGFIFLFQEKSSFEIKGLLGLIVHPILYPLVVMGAFFSLFIGMSRNPFAAIHFRWIILFALYTLSVAVVYRIAGGISIPTVFVYMLLLLASPVIHANGRFMLRAAGLALLLNSLYSVMQSLSVIGVISTYDLPVIPLAFDGSDGLATFDLRRASGFYFQPLAAGSIFGLASLSYWKLHQRTGDLFFGIVHLASLIGLLLSQSWAATGLAFVFYFWLGRWRLRLGLMFLILCATAFVLLNADLIRAVADIYSSKMDNSGKTKIGLVLMHIAYFLNNPHAILMGGVFDVGIPYTENTFLNLCYLFGVVPAIILPLIILRHSAGNIRRWRRSGNHDPVARGAAEKLNLVILYPFLLMFFQNSAVVPPVIVLLVLLLSWNHHDAAAAGEPHSS